MSDRIPRLLRLISLLHSGRARTAHDIMAELGVSRRTLFRDLGVLRDAGIPYYHDPQTGYRIAQSFYLPPISLTIPETLGLLLLAQTARSLRRGRSRAATLSAVNKLITAVPEPIRLACSDMMRAVNVNPYPQPVVSDEEAHRFELQKLADEQRRCHIVYRSLYDQSTIETDLDPYALHFVGTAWYVLGRSAMHDQVRTFKLARMQAITALDEHFTRPRDFCVTGHLDGAWRLIPEGQQHLVELEFSAKVATNVSETFWHPTQESKMLPDGRCIMRFEVNGLGEIAWWICGYGDQVSVRKPAALRRRVRDMHTAAAQRNNGK